MHLVRSNGSSDSDGHCWHKQGEAGRGWGWGSSGADEVEAEAEAEAEAEGGMEMLLAAWLHCLQLQVINFTTTRF